MRHIEYANRLVLISAAMALFIAAVALAQVNQPMDSNLSVNRENLEYFTGLNISNVNPAGNDEYIILYNNGDRAPSLLGWKISVDGTKNMTLPDYVFDPLTSVKIHFGQGETNRTDLYLDQGANILNDQTGDIKLFDDTGALITEMKY